MFNLIDGKSIAKRIRAELKEEVATFKLETGITPGLAVILVGARPDSASYVRSKKKHAKEVGFRSVGVDYDATVSEEEIIQKIDELNEDPDIHGILVQLPLPPHINEQRVIERVHPDKDVDGLHPLNVAKLCNTNTHARPTSGRRRERKSSFADMRSLDFHIACTPQGCIELLDRQGVSIEGKEVVVIGRSNIVGLPVSLLMMQRNGTVTIVHSRTKNLPEKVRQADIVVAAVGRPFFVRGDWIKEGAVVIDVGINQIDDMSSKSGHRLVGDVHFDEAVSKAQLITPVPGGVGPMTIAMLLRNTMNGAKRVVNRKWQDETGWN
jgi:5,10-methylene-tetrahydrofolate dehydrogenase/methenyl tetrahydrofolate cyclohydrolase